MITLNKLFEDYVVTNHGGVVTPEAIAEAYAIFLGLTGEFTAKDERIAYWVDKNISTKNFAEQFLKEAEHLNAKNAAAYGETQVGRSAVVSAAREAAVNGDDLEAIRQKVADVVASQPGEGEQPGVPSEDLTLTAGRDTLPGTANDDVFTANVVQNDSGNLVNSLATGDVIEGNGGNNILKAQLINAWGGPGQGDTLAVMPMLNNVQTVEIQALDAGATGNVLVDAVHMNGTNHYASVNSRGNLEILNVRIEGDQRTEDVTIEMRNTASNSNTTIAGSSMDVRFEQSSLRAQQDFTTASAQFYIELANAFENDADAPIKNAQLVNLSFNHDGNEFQANLVQSADGTYEGLAVRINELLAEQGLADRYEARVGEEEITRINETNLTVLAKRIIIEDTSEQAEPFDDIDISVGNITGSGTAASIQGDSGVYFVPDTTTFDVTSKVILDNVGRGSDGGDLTIGSMSASNTSTGVQVFDIQVKNNSNVGNFYSTNQALKELKITNAAGYEGDLIFRNDDNDVTASNGANTINGKDLIQATGFAGNLYLGNKGASDGGITVGDATVASKFLADANLTTTGAITNVDTIDVKIAGDVYLNANYTGTTSHSIATGTGNDYIVVNQAATNQLEITAQGGDNQIWVQGGTTAENVTIETGSGRDVIHGWDSIIDVNTGAGNDVIYAQNNGDKAAATYTNTISEATPAAQTGSAYAAGNVHFMAGMQVKVTVSAGTAAAAGSNVNGFESQLVTIQPSSGALTTRADVNNAIAAAVNDNDVLNKIVTATVNGDDVEFTYLVDGARHTDAIQVEFSVPEGRPATASSAVVNEYRDLVNYSTVDANALWASLHTTPPVAANADATDNVGTASTGGGNSINAGSGDDVIVLTSAATGDTVVFTNLNQGHNTIVNFDATNDRLDFTSYLTNTVRSDANTTSNSDASQVDMGNTFAGNLNFTASSVNVINYSDLTKMAAGVKFGDMSTAQLKAALDNASAGVAVSETTGLGQTTAKSVLLVADTDHATAIAGYAPNAGVFKAYEITYANTEVTGAEAGNFTVNLIGTLDFGQAQTLTVTQFVDVA